MKASVRVPLQKIAFFVSVLSLGFGAGAAWADTLPPSAGPSFAFSPALIRAKQPPLPEFPPCGPESETVADVTRSGNRPESFALPSLNFCAEWNPEFAANGHHCCGKLGWSTRKNRKLSCAQHRRFSNYCSEMTVDQVEYTERAKQGKLGDVLELINRQMGARGEQSYCTVNNGFMAWGRRLIPSEANRVEIRRPDRCTDFGTDPMVGMLEWAGRQIAKQYPAPQYAGVKLLVGDISAPRGGCLSGRGGRRGHLSHTTGIDVDLSFLAVSPGGRTPSAFHKQFNTKENWWFLKKIFQNPYACVKVVFLDKKLIRKLGKEIGRDEDWKTYQRFIRHMPGHKNHFHVRIGDGPGEPGCAQNPDLELEEGFDEQDALDASTAMERERNRELAGQPTGTASESGRED